MEVLEMTVDTQPAESREKLFEDLYGKAFPVFARFAATMNASFEDAKDIFHDALVIYFEKTLDPSVRIRSIPEAYVLGIARHLWLKKFRKDRRELTTDLAGEQYTVPSDYFADENELRLLNFIERFGKRCLDILQKFYFERLPLKEIATSLGYRTEHSAAVQKFKCIGKLKEAIKARAIKYEDFTF